MTTVRRRRLAWLGVGAVLLAGCFKQVGPDILPNRTVIIPLTPRATETAPAATATFAPLASPTMPALGPFQTVTQTESVQNMILFSADISFPLDLPGALPVANRQYPQLWGISPDGQRVKRFTQDDEAAAFYFFANSSDTPLLLTSASLALASDRLKLISLPSECRKEISSDGDWRPCSDFQFSANGAWATFAFGREGCGQRSLGLLKVATGETWPVGQGALVHLFADGRVLYSGSACEDEEIRLFDPQTGAVSRLGGDGRRWWNKRELAVAFEATIALSAWRPAWAYSLDTAAVFLTPAVGQVDTHPVWAPDDQNLLYEHGTMTYTNEVEHRAVFSPREIWVVDRLTGDKKKLVGDSVYDYHLNDGQDGIWQGEWVQIRRFQRQMGEGTDGETSDATLLAQTHCIVDGKDCVTAPELLALNWRTGESKPGALTPPPASASTATPVFSPALDRAPLYTDPTGTYALYVSSDEHSLWLVPRVGAPVLWVRRGADFVYIR